MDKFVIDFINTYQEEIDANDWDTVYKADKWSGHFELIGQFTEVLLDCGIDPLKTLNYVPCFYLYGATHQDEIIVGEQVTSIDDWAFKSNAGYLRKIYLPQSIERIGFESFKNCSNMVGNELEIIYDGTVAEWNKIIFDHPYFPRYYKVKTKEGWTR